MDVLRTPEDRFVDLPDFDWEPRYIETSDGLRVSCVDEGDVGSPVVLMIHGEPSWSFLYRSMIPVFLDAGFRTVAPDLIGLCPATCCAPCPIRSTLCP